MDVKANGMGETNGRGKPMSEETGQAPQTDARALIRNIQSFLSLFIAGAFAVSVIATRSYFSFFSEALNNLLTFSDYIVFR